jgi:hypothetical protein
MSEDYVMQGAFGNFSNFSTAPWTYGQPLCYWVDPQLHFDLTTFALPQWSPIPQLTWIPSSHQSCLLPDGNPRIDVFIQHIPFGPNGPSAEAFPTDWDYLLNGAKRVSSWVVSINSDAWWGQNTRRAVLAHELGHVYGLGEQYWRDHMGSSACSNLPTVMDATKNENPNFPSPRVPCTQYGYNVQPADIDRARFFHTSGPAVNTHIGQQNGTIGNWMVAAQYPWPSTAIFDWRDGAWDEGLQVLDVWWSTNEGPWNTQAIFLADFVGFPIGWVTNHPYNINGWQMQYLFDRNAWGTPGGSNTVYMVCGYTWHYMFGYTNNYSCSQTAFTLG